MGQSEYAKRSLAAGLAVLAGFLDALGFLKLGSMFVSFMSGNTTRLAVAIANGAAARWVAAGLIGSFVLGVVAGALLSRWSGRWRKQAVLALVLVLVFIAAAVTLGGGKSSFLTLPMACAMGAANNVFQREGEVSIAVTYMTGTLVKFGQKLAAALCGGPRWDWAPHLLLWIGLVAGALAGGAAYPKFGLHALWIAVAAAAGLFAASFALGPLPPEEVLEEER